MFVECTETNRTRLITTTELDNLLTGAQGLTFSQRSEISDPTILPRYLKGAVRSDAVDPHRFEFFVAHFVNAPLTPAPSLLRPPRLRSTRSPALRPTARALASYLPSEAFAAMR